MEGRSKLFLKARDNYFEKPHIVNHILKRKNYYINNFNNINKIDINNNKSTIIKKTENEKNILVNINNIHLKQNNNEIDNKNNISINENKNNSPLILPIINNNSNINLIYNIKQIKQNNNINDSNLEKFNINDNKKIKIKKQYYKENILYTIIIFFDSKTLKNFMLSCKKFYNICKNYDIIWFNYYNKKFNQNNNKINYNLNKGKWYLTFMNVIKKNTNRNFNNIKKNFLNKNKKFYNKKDVYFLINNVYKYLKPYYYLIINESIKIDINNSFYNNDNNSSINFLINMENKNININEIFNLSIFFNEKNIGIFDKKIYNNNIKEKKFKNYNENTNFNIYYNNEIILIIKKEEENNNILLINISLQICKIIEKIFDFIENIHTNKNLKKNFIDLYDYSLLINLKNSNQIFYTININTLDFISEEEDEDNLYYKNNSITINNNDIKFDINDNNFIENFLIMDLILLNSNGKHIICDSKILIILKDTKNIDVDYNNYYCEKYIGIINDKYYNIKFKFNINKEENYFALVYFELKIKKCLLNNI